MIANITRKLMTELTEQIVQVNKKINLGMCDEFCELRNSLSTSMKHENVYYEFSYKDTYNDIMNFLNGVENGVVVYIDFDVIKRMHPRLEYNITEKIIDIYNTMDVQFFITSNSPFVITPLLENIKEEDLNLIIFTKTENDYNFTIADKSIIDYLIMCDYDAILNIKNLIKNRYGNE